MSEYKLVQADANNPVKLQVISDPSKIFKPPSNSSGSFFGGSTDTETSETLAKIAEYTQPIVLDLDLSGKSVRIIVEQLDPTGRALTQQTVLLKPKRKSKTQKPKGLLDSLFGPKKERK